MIGHIFLWFVLGVGASILLNMAYYHRVALAGTQAIISVVGAVIGGLVMLIAAPNAPGWALLTALMGSVIALTISWISRQVREQEQAH